LQIEAPTEKAKKMIRENETKYGSQAIDFSTDSKEFLEDYLKQ